jgi:ubiquinol-cytochrome c reductase iron-sulfur subunit
MVDTNKRRFLIVASSAVGGIGVVAAATPFVMSFWPSARARAAGAPVEVDISKIEAGQLITVEWRGNVCWLLNRTKPMLESLPKLDSRLADPNSNVAQQPPYCKNEHRSIKDSMWVAIGICTHLGC